MVKLKNFQQSCIFIPSYTKSSKICFKFIDDTQDKCNFPSLKSNFSQRFLDHFGKDEPFIKHLNTRIVLMGST